jgi:hypothetical protein
MNQDWSDDEDNNEEELIQPDRDFPISDEEEEEDEYDMYELSQLTVKNNAIDDLFEKKIENKNIIINNTNKKQDVKLKFSDLFIKKNNTNEKRKFNPRLPPPDKYCKKN